MGLFISVDLENNGYTLTLVIINWLIKIVYYKLILVLIFVIVLIKIICKMII